MAIPAPFTSFRGEVRPEWVNLAGHMGLAFYLLLFDAGAQALFTSLGAGDAYQKSGGAYFAAETHVVYERELHPGDKVNIITTILNADSKRIHLAQEIFRDGEAARISMQEIMYLSVSLATRRTAPWLQDVMANINAALALHAALPRPAKLGRRIGITP
jgi:acyl-CoA thioester hydrolase